ncbi:MAG: TonB-dependent receptor [Candidatus Rariloculaceae bacterium]
MSDRNTDYHAGRPGLSLALGLLAIPFLPNLLFAQSQAEEDVLEEIVVTAGFRDNDLMTTAGSVSVVSEEVIDDRAAQHLESILNAAANVNYSSASSRARFVQIRGIGDLEQFVDPKHYPSVGITLDDVNFGGTANAGMLFDAEQVEILRGPQGTRFGGSALAGMVNIRSHRPTDTFEGYVEAGAGNYGSWNLGGVVSGPLGDTVKGRIAVQQNQADGYIDNTFLGRSDTNGYEETSLRATLDFDPSDDSDYSLTAFYYDGQNGYDAYSLDNNRNTLSDSPGRDFQESLALSGRANWRLSDTLELELVGTWSDSEIDYAFDEDWSFDGLCDGTLCAPADAFSNTDVYLRDRDELSVDFRLLGSTDNSGLQYVVGLYAQERDEDLYRSYYGDFNSTYATERQAIYGQIEVPLSDRLDLTAGLRYEQFDDSYSDSFDARSASDDVLHSGEMTLTYQATDQTLLYATLSRGDKAGGFNTSAISNLPLLAPEFQAFLLPRLRVRTETLLNHEVGLKGSYLDGRIDLRAALFYMDRDDAQLESWTLDFVPFIWTGFLDNADGSNEGFEVDMNYRLSSRFELFGSIGYLQTNVEELTTFDVDLGDFVVKRDIDQAKSPEWQYNVGGKFYFSENLAARLEFEGRDDSRYGYYHDGGIGSYNLVNASLNYRIGRTELQLWGRNLTDEDYAVHGLYFGNDPRKGYINETYSQYGEPRVVGIMAKYLFE